MRRTFMCRALVATLVGCCFCTANVDADQGTVTKWLQRPFAPEDVIPDNPMSEHQGENTPSDMDWRLPTALPNWVAADDFISDGRPILTVRWWGSYFDTFNLPQPMTNPDGTVKFRPVVEDAYAISFFSDIPADQNPHGLPYSQPGELLGTYIAPIDVVRVDPTPWIGWDTHRTWQYEVNLQDTHLDHPSPLATPISFDEVAGDIYWIAIQAINGVRILHNPDGSDEWIFEHPDFNEDPIAESTRPDGHFWGWHSSRDHFNDDAVMNHVVMDLDQWIYPNDNWRLIQFQHPPERDLAFELKTIPEPSSLVLLGLACVGLGMVLRRRR